MARRGRSGKRDPFGIASPRLHYPIVLPRRRLSLLPIEDRRLYHPLKPFQPARAIGVRSSSRVVLDRPKSRPFRFPDVLRFAVPRKVAVCVRRKERREALFAKKLMRSGAGGKKRRNYWSGISCR